MANKLPWHATFRYMSATWVPGPARINIHCGLAREPDRRVMLVLEEQEARHIHETLGRYLTDMEMRRNGTDNQRTT
jgi:hypothetical protein